MKRLWLTIGILFIAGCASVSVQKYYKDVVFPSTNPAKIIILNEKPAEKNYTELGEITVAGASTWPEVEKIFRGKAGQLGADSVYVVSKQEETKQYISPNDCFVREGYYYPYHHFGWHRYYPHNFYPRGYFYCYGYQSTVETASFITAVGIAIKYTGPAK